MLDKTDDQPRARRPPPSRLLVGNAVCVVALSVALAVGGAMELSAPSNPFTFMGALCFTPGYVALGAAQSVAVVRRSAGAAGLTSALAACAAALLGFGFFTTFADCVTLHRSFDLGDVRALALLALATAYSVFTAVLNYRWVALLRRPLPAGFCIYCGYDLRASPGRCPECGRPS